MGTNDLILGLELMFNIYQVQIHKDQRPIPNPKIATGYLVLVKDLTTKSFMPKYQTDFRVIRILGNTVEVKDNNGKMSQS